MSHFTHETSSNKQLTTDSARKIYNLYVSKGAPLRVALEDDVFEDIQKVCSIRPLVPFLLIVLGGAKLENSSSREGLHCFRLRYLVRQKPSSVGRPPSRQVFA